MPFLMCFMLVGRVTLVFVTLSNVVFIFVPFCGHAGQTVVLAGDGRCDSPGYSAKYGTYTLMDTTADLIVDFQLTECTEATSSIAMEKYGFDLTLDRCLEN